MVMRVACTHPILPARTIWPKAIDPTAAAPRWPYETGSGSRETWSHSLETGTRLGVLLTHSGASGPGMRRPRVTRPGPERNSRAHRSFAARRAVLAPDRVALPLFGCRSQLARSHSPQSHSDCVRTDRDGNEPARAGSSRRLKPGRTLCSDVGPVLLPRGSFDIARDRFGIGRERAAILTDTIAITTVRVSLWSTRPQRSGPGRHRCCPGRHRCRTNRRR
jgi:hypothetical protein